MEKKTIGSFLCALRRAHGMTQKELGEHLFVSDKTISRWERDECTPDLSLIPTIADLFGITADELLRGERKQSSATSAQAKTPTVSEETRDARSERQFRLLLDRRTIKYKNLSLISLAIAIFGLLMAAIINLGFLRAYIALGVGMICLLSSLVTQLCFANAARLRPDEEEEYEERIARINAHNEAVTMTVLRVCALLLGILAFCLPLAFVGDAHFGLTLSAWMLCGCLSAATVLLLSYLVWVFWLRALLVRRELLQSDEAKEHFHAAHRRLLTRTVLWGLGGLLGFGILAGGVVRSLPFEWLVAPTEFDNYEDFQAYMAAPPSASPELDILPPNVDVWVEVLPEDVFEDGKLPPSEDDEIHVGESALTEELRNHKGELLCTYINRKISYTIEISDADDGLPIRVYTSAHYARAKYVRQLITASLAALTLAYLGVLIGIHIRDRRRLQRRS